MMALDRKRAATRVGPLRWRPAFWLVAGGCLVLALVFLPSLAQAAGDGHVEGVPWKKLGYYSLNLGLLVGLLVYLLRRPLGDALKNRSTEIRRAIVEAQDARDAAQAEMEKLQEKLSHFEDEVARLRHEVRAEAERERRFLVERAEKEAAAIQLSAERAIREEARRARRALQEDAVRLAVQLAEETLHGQVSAAEQKKLAQDLLAAIEQNQAALSG